MTRHGPCSVLRLAAAFPDRSAGLHGILGAEISRHRAGSPDTWTVAALLDGLPGSVPERLGVAVAAAAPAAAPAGN